MGGLYRKEVIVKSTSTSTTQEAKDFAKSWLNDTFQNKADNKDAEGNDIDYFFADVFDARNGNIYKVFSDACETKYGMTNLVFDVLVTSNFATAAGLESTDTAVLESLETIESLETTVGEHTDRLVALENEEDAVEAVVI